MKILLALILSAGFFASIFPGQHFEWVNNNTRYMMTLSGAPPCVAFSWEFRDGDWQYDDMYILQEEEFRGQSGNIPNLYCVNGMLQIYSYTMSPIQNAYLTFVRK